MNTEELGACLDSVRKTSPLVHCITNYVTVNDCANAVLAIGASPIMSDEPDDVEDITSICQGLDLNIGTLNRRSIEGMNHAAAKAASLGHASCSIRSVPVPRSFVPRRHSTCSTPTIPSLSAAT
jgi:hydroxyethylthiazole kinase